MALPQFSLCAASGYNRTFLAEAGLPLDIFTSASSWTSAAHQTGNESSNLYEASVFALDELYAGGRVGVGAVDRGIIEVDLNGSEVVDGCSAVPMWTEKTYYSLGNCFALEVRGDMN